MNNMKKLPILIWLLFFAFETSAFENKVGDFANKCSGLFLIMTMPEGEDWKPFTENMGELSTTMNLVAAGIYERSGNNPLTGTRSEKIKQLMNESYLEADKIINLYKNDVSSVLGLYARCDKFREDFAYSAMNNPNSDTATLESLQIPDRQQMNEEKTGLINMILELSFSTLEKEGIYSIFDLYKRN
jgi:hypothetical protein